ncbi:malectin domain-containing carbohydrate-binding protein [Geodermatophilus sp. DSM 44513]|uniref:malectin domain-containing carbohydrate-binding protein n=1 Tax=Geodermatophilus sp. DSM 44513 TaxID=1528104 RepID=UPI0028F6DF99|nr:malectin domain-containing carbohydrate-binding protein [Geodermatophilus sp. DSM 44513]WNV76201.1 malectin domain-containing carbohydrate-binding protein [Geodermatophilus sp. DSM 44513]
MSRTTPHLPSAAVLRRRAAARTRRALAAALGAALVTGLVVVTPALAATSVEPALRHAFTFDGADTAAVAGLQPLADAAGTPLGFTVVQPHGPRPAGEAPPAAGPDQPALRSVADGRLTLTTTPGIQFRSVATGGTGGYNLLDNALGVPVAGDDETVVLETTLVDPLVDAANGSKQAGLWLGRGQDDLVKLVLVDGAGANVRNAAVQLQVEVDGSVTTTAGVDQIELPLGALPTGARVGLRLTVDAAAGRVAGQYRVGDGAWTAVTAGAATSLPVETGAVLDDPATTAAVEAAAGVFATRRGDATAGKVVAYSFEDFSLRAGDTTPPAAPTGLQAVAGTASVELTWNGPADAAGYRVLRAEGDGDATQIATTTTGSHTDSAVTAASTYRYSVVALDAAGNASDAGAAVTVTVAATPVDPEEPAAACAPWSTLPCADLPVELPAALTFDGTEGGLGSGAGGTGAGTGFTMVQPSDADPAYDPAALQVADGELRITAGPGIAFSGSTTGAVNKQVNTLGVGLTPTAPFTLQTTVVDPYTDGSPNSEQAGLWLGLGQDDYAKLVVVNNGAGRIKVQLLREIGKTYASATDEVNSTDVAIPATGPVRLQLAVDPATGVLTGSYAAGDGPLTALPATLTVPTWLLDDTQRPAALTRYTPVEGAGTWAGVFASKRNAPEGTPVVARFADFGIAASATGGGPTDPTDPPAGPCAPWSPLPCADLPVELPAALTFDGTEGGLGTGAGGAGPGTGFTMVQPSDADPAYDPAALQVADGELRITAGPGIAFSGSTTGAVNKQVNTLGVGLTPTAPFTLQTTVVDPYTDGSPNSEQAGLWLGLGQDDYAKLVVVNNGAGRIKVQLLREIGKTYASATDEVNSTDLAIPATGPVRLQLAVDPATGVLTGSYAAGDGPLTALPATLTVPTWLLDDTQRPAALTRYTPVEGAGTWAGVFASKRFETAAPVVARFADFGIAAAGTGGGPTDPTDPPAGPVDVRVVFSDAAKVPPAGHLRDFGEAYSARTGAFQGSGLTFGWVTPGTGTPQSMVGNGRDRTTGPNAVTPADPRLGSLLHMQLPSTVTGGVKAPGAWEVAVPEGVYEVTVSVGDPGTAVDSEHWLNVEDQNAVALFVPTAGTRHATATRTVAVDDGRLTLTPTGGTNTKINHVTVRTAPDFDADTTPRVLNATPVNGATGVPTLGGAVASIAGPAGGISGDSLTAETVRLERLPDGADVPVTRFTSAGGDVVSVAPTSSTGLQPNTSYRFTVDGVTDDAGTRAQPWSSVFTTGAASTTPGGGGTGSLADVAFTKQALPGTEGGAWISVAFGPDGKLYASSVFGDIARWTVGADGTLGAREDITSIRDFHAGDGMGNGRSGDMRTVIGLAFGPRPGAAPGEEQVLWVSDNITFLGERNVPEWDVPARETSGIGYLTVPADPAQSVFRRVVENLPRSKGDHMTNSPVWHDGKLYFPVGANTSTGAPDSNWGRRSEKLLSAAVLELDVTKLGADQVLDAKTVEGGGSYDPYAPGAPLRVYATGNRNTFDLVSHTNGALYAPTNGSAANGNVPGSTWRDTRSSTNSRERDAYYPQVEHCVVGGPYTGPEVPLKVQLPDETDHLFTLKEGAYYGHPNPTRCEFVFNGANPTAGADPFEYTGYPVGTRPDPRYDLAGTFDAGMHASANGAVEYRSTAFGGALRGKLVYTRFSQTGDLVVVSPDPATTNITGPRAIGLPGLTGYTGPLDITEDTRGDTGAGTGNGNLYVASMSQNDPSNSRITLLRPQGGAAPNIASATLEAADDVVGGAAAPLPVTIRNTGNAPLTIPAGGLSLAGAGAARFSAAGVDLPAVLAPGASVRLPLTFAASAVGVVQATLQVSSDDPDTPVLSVPLRGLGTAGLGGANEPSLQRVLDVLGYPVDVGDPDPATNPLGTAARYGAEVDLQRMVAAVDAPVTVTPLAVFGPTSVSPAVRVGWHVDGSAGTSASDPDRRELFTVRGDQAQDVRITPTGTTSFDPGTDVFGLYSSWPFFYGQHGQDYAVSTQDRLNTWDAANAHHVRAYPVPGQPDTYVVGMEEHTSGADYQDVVLLVTNVRPAPAPANAAVLSVSNLDGVTNAATGVPAAQRTPIPSADRVVLSRLGGLDGEFATTQRVHDRAQVRIANTGTEPMQVTGVSTTAGFTAALPAGTPLPLTLAPGASVEATVTFNHDRTDNRRNELVEGTLTVTSTAGTGSTATVALAGMYQRQSENGDEPDFQQVLDTFGWTTSAPADELNEGVGGYEAVGDEVLSPYWRRADAGAPVRFTQIAALHGCCSTGGGDTLSTHVKGSNSTTARVQHGGLWGQSLLPAGTGNTTLAQGTYSPALDQSFGIKIGPEWSDPAKNNGALDKTNGCTAAVCGHHVRFFPVRDATGAVVPNTYVFGMDFSGINYDFQDNMYLVENVRPEAGSAPQGLTAVAGDRQVSLSWAPNGEDGVTAYQVFRSTSLPVPTTGTPLATVTGLSAPSFVDRSVANGTAYSYAVRAVYGASVGGGTSPASDPATATPLPPESFAVKVDFGSPATPLVDGYLADFGQAYGPRSSRGQGSGQVYGWVRPGTATPLDLSVGGSTPGNGRDRGLVDDVRLDSLVHVQANLATPVPFNGTPEEGAWEIAVPAGTYAVTVAAGDPLLVQSPDRHTIAVEGVRLIDGFTPTGASGASTRWTTASGQVTVSDGRLTVTAGDGSNTKIQYIDVTATAAPVDTTPPPAVTDLAATVTEAAVTLNWADSPATDLLGYTVERAPSAEGPWTVLAGSAGDPLLVSALVDAGAPVGSAVSYRVVAVDTSDNASAPSVVGATRPAPAPPAAVTGLVATGTTGGIALDWADSPADGLAGYRVERAPAATGPWTVLTPAPLTASAYTDTTVAAGATASYRVTALGTNGTVSAPTTASATRPAPVPPAAVTGLVATGSTTGIALDWADGPAQGLAGYRVERAPAATGPWTALTTAALTASAYTDTTVAAGATAHYRVTALGTNGTVSAPATASATRPALPPTPGGSTVRINAGGPTQKVGSTTWTGCASVSACNGWVSGGFAYSEKDTNTGIPAGMNNTVFQSEWTGGFTDRRVPVGGRAFRFDVPVTNGQYTVRLHFAELNKFRAGTRVFSVDVEGQRKLTDFDIWKAAGGNNKAISRSFTTTVTDGKVTVDFLRGVENAKVSAIEILPAGQVQPPPEPTPGGSTVRINAGGPTQKVGSTTWTGCASVSACNGWVSGGFAYSEKDTNTGIPAGMNNTVFQSEWTGGFTDRRVPVGGRAFRFDVPVTNGQYTVRLHFAELNKFRAGTRVFSVDVEGQRKLTDFDIWKAAGGNNKAISRSFTTTVTDGKVTVDFLRGVENAKVSAIEILPAG